VGKKNFTEGLPKETEKKHFSKIGAKAETRKRSDWTGERGVEKGGVAKKRTGQGE